MPQVTKRYGQIVEDLLKTVDGTTVKITNRSFGRHWPKLSRDINYLKQDKYIIR